MKFFSLWIKVLCILSCKLHLFSACLGSYNIYESCGPDTKEVCIWRGLFNDNYVNCPVKCFDEGSCFKSPGMWLELGMIMLLVTVI